MKHDHNTLIDVKFLEGEEGGGGAMFIQGATSIPDFRIAQILLLVWNYVQLFVLKAQ